MQRNILILWLGAFGFAIAKHLGENNPEQNFYASEVNPEIFESISNTRMHPYFFEGVKLPENIKLVSQTPHRPSDTSPQWGEEKLSPSNWKGVSERSKEEGMFLENILSNIDIIISIIPCQFVGWAFESMKSSLKDGVTILNLSKWIDNTSLQTVSEKLAEVLEWVDYNYAYLAGGMIAQELVDWKMLGADIVAKNNEIWTELKELFLSNSLDINLKIWSPKNTELYAALKNIIALILWYYEGKWSGASTKWYYLAKLLEEMKWVITLLTPPQSPSAEGEASESEQGEYNFTDYALCGDLIATCFWGSRNRLLWTMLGQWKDISEALSELKAQNKIAEGYETLKWVYKLTKWKEWFEEINRFGRKYL